ncbi:MAG: YraN family protein [Paracoccaceae bacterium]
MTQKSERSARSYQSGLAAEQQVARDYERRGYSIVCHRWRGAGGEIDLIARNSNEIVFIEVKQSRTVAHTALRLSPRQMERIFNSAAQFLEREPDGQLTPSRFDVALVGAADGFEIVENAFGQL